LSYKGEKDSGEAVVSKELYDKQLITQYLLGTLTTAECERLDELSVTDNVFADSLKVAENELVDAYIQGELSEPVLHQFRSSYLASPLRREKVRFAEVLQTFAGTSLGSDRVEQSKQIELKNSPFRFLRWPLLSWQNAVVILALLLSGLSFWLILDNRRLRREIAQTPGVNSPSEQELRNELEQQRAAKARLENEVAELRKQREQKDQPNTPPEPKSVNEGSILALALAPQLRDAGQTPAIKIPPRTSYVATQLRLEPNEFTTYRATLIRPGSSEARWSIGNLTSRVNGNAKTLSVSIPANLLKPGDYAIRVFGSSAGRSEMISDYPFRVEK
jgi:hypothetical protein